MYNLLYKIALNTAGIPPAFGDGVHALAYKIAQNTAGTLPAVGDGLYNLFYKIAGNTAGIPPEPGDGLPDLLYKITENTAGRHSVVGDSRINLLYKIAGNTTEGGAAIDSDVSSFFTRASITNVVQQGAISELVLALKTANLWAKMRALYPFVGGTAASHSENLKNASYQITWNGGISHSANGITGNGTDAWANTGFDIMNTTYGSIAFGIYNRTSAIDTNADIKTNVGPEYAIYSRYGNGNFLGISGSYGGHSVQLPNPDAKGFYVVSRESLSLYRAYKNGTQFGSNVTNAPDGPLVNDTFLLLGNPSTFCAHNLALAFISDGLVDAEVAVFNTAAGVYQTALGRNV